MTKKEYILINSADKCNASAKLQRRYPKLKRTAGGQPMYSKDRRKSPEPFQTLPEDHRIFSKLFQVSEYRRQYLLRTSVVIPVVNEWSEALTSLFFSSVLSV